MTSKKREKSLKNTKNTHSITSHSTPEAEDEVKSGLLLDVVVRESTTILQLLAGEDEPLLIRGNSFLVLDFSFNILDGIRRLNLQGNGLACQRLDKDLHPSPQPEHEVQGGLLLNVIVGEGPAIFQLLPCEDEPLLVRGGSFLVLDFCFHVLDGVRGLHLQSDSLPGQRLHEDLHPTPQPQNKVQCGLLLDVVIGEGPAILQLFPREDEPLLVWGNPLLVLDLGLDIFNGVGRLDFQGDGFPGQGLDEDLHTYVFSCRSESSNY